jgi:hypothetical protein
VDFSAKGLNMALPTVALYWLYRHQTDNYGCESKTGIDGKSTA